MNDQTKSNTLPSPDGEAIGDMTKDMIYIDNEKFAKEWHRFYNTFVTLHRSSNLILLPKYDNLTSSDKKALTDTAQAMLNKYIIYEKKPIPKQKDKTGMDYLDKMIELFKTKNRPMSTAELGIINNMDNNRMFIIMRDWSNHGYFKMEDRPINTPTLMKDGTTLDRIDMVTFWSLADK